MGTTAMATSLESERSIEKNCTLLINWDKGGVFNINDIRERLQNADTEEKTAALKGRSCTC